MEKNTTKTTFNEVKSMPFFIDSFVFQRYEYVGDKAIVKCDVLFFY